MAYKDLLITRTSKFQTNLKSPNNASRPYEDQIKKRLNKKEFSTYKIYDQKVNGIGIIGQIRYVDEGYWENNYTISYTNSSYPTPPEQP